MEAGIKPMFREFQEGNHEESSHGDPVAYVQSENSARRQLSDSQLAYAITHPNILEFERRRAAERLSASGGDRKSGGADGRHPIEDSGRTAKKLAEKAGVGERTVAKANTRGGERKNDQSPVRDFDTVAKRAESGIPEPSPRGAPGIGWNRIPRPYAANPHSPLDARRYSSNGVTAVTAEYGDADR